VRNLSVLWRWLDRPGHDAARLSFEDGEWHLAGATVFAHEREPWRLDYRVVCDADWRTRSATVRGWAGERAVDIAIDADAAGRWRLNGVECPAAAGCIDVDLGFTPSTNLLPIRRLALAVGGEAPVRSAWLSFPSLTLEPLEQRYRRTAETTYAYESRGGEFSATLRVNEAGLVLDYPPFWRAEAGS
jgi:uncharacterized protein